MGPTCRKKHGFDSPDVEIGNLETLLIPSEVQGETTRQVANKIVYRIAIGVSHKDLHPIKLANYLTLLDKIGFQRLASNLAKNAVKVKITAEAESLIVDSDYNESFVSRCRSIPGRRWNHEKKVNTFPVSSKAQLFTVLRECYAGSIGVGPKGFFAL